MIEMADEVVVDCASEAGKLKKLLKAQVKNKNINYLHQ